MCTFGKVTDHEKFDAWCKENKLKFAAIKGEELVTTPAHQLYEIKEARDFFAQTKGDFFDLMLTKKEIIAKAEEDLEATYILCGGWGEGEDDFYWNGNEYNYDLVDDDDFPRDVEMLSSAGEKQGFQRLDGCCYAGRNG